MNGAQPARGRPASAPRASPAALLLLALAAAACAHGRDAAVRTGTRGVEDPALGYRLEVPETGFRAAEGREGVVAAAGDGTRLRVFPEHFAQAPDLTACWTRLLTRLPDDLAQPPRDAADLAARAPRGLDRTTSRRLHFMPYPRGSTCLVLVAEGPAASPLLAEAAALGMRSFRPLQPSAAMQVRLDFDAATQLFDLGEHAAALERFERVLAVDPDQPRARLGAGLSAFFAGDAHAARAVDHLERVLVLQQDEGARAMGSTSRRDALMYLGLAYAALKQYPKATERLGELVARQPEDAVALYNFACVLALGGDAEGALYNLRSAIQRDPALAAQAKTDQDFTSLRPRPEWDRLLRDAPAGEAARTTTAP